LAKRESVSHDSGDVLGDRLEALRALIPEAFTEDKIDFDRLRASLGDELATTAERYSFAWAGKRDAIRILQTPSRATLIPAHDESIDFDSTNNIFIEGDNLEVLKLLYKPYFGRVKLIYLDPPYNTGTDRVYVDDYSDPIETYLRLTSQADGNGGLLTSNPEANGRFHSTWLSMMYPRLFIARQLLREDGVIFVSIDDTEAANLRLILNEIFGEENFLANIAWEKRYTRSNNAKLFYSLKDSILVYRKSAAVEGLRESRTDKANAIYSNPDADVRGPWASSSYVNPATKTQRPNLVYPIRNPFTGAVVEHPTNAWKYSQDEHKRHVNQQLLWWGKNGTAKYPRLKNFLTEAEGSGLVPIDLWDYKSTGTTDEGGTEVKELFGEAVFDNPKPTRLMRRMLRLATAEDEHAIVLDFFAGSGSTAHAVLLQNAADAGDRCFVMVQLPEPTPENSVARKAGYANIAEIAKERIRRSLHQISVKGTEQLPLKGNAAPDLGMRVYRLAESNFAPWPGITEHDEESYAQTMALFTDALVDGWRPLNVIWEVALREGYGLASRVEAMKMYSATDMYRVTDADSDQSFVICLDSALAPATLKELGLTKDDLFVCRDSALDDEAAANLALQCRLKTI